MANLTTLLYPVSVVATNWPITLTTSTTNGLSSKFNATGTVFNIQGVSFDTQQSYLQIRVDNASAVAATLVYTRIIKPNENFDIIIPYGIKGSPFHIVLSYSPTDITVANDLYFITVNFK